MHASNTVAVNLPGGMFSAELSNSEQVPVSKVLTLPLRAVQPVGISFRMQPDQTGPNESRMWVIYGTSTRLELEVLPPLHET